MWFIRLILGLTGLFLITVVTMMFGIGGFLFVLGFFAVLQFAFGKQEETFGEYDD